MALPSINNIPKEKRSLIIGIVLLVIALIAVNGYVMQQVNRAREEERKRTQAYLANQTTVLVAKRDIKMGTPLDSEVLSSEIIAGRNQEPRAVSSLARVDGMIAAVDIARGEQITLDKLIYPREKGGLSAATPIGKRAVTISVDNIASLAGMIKPGDYVDMVAAMAVPAVGADGKQTTQGMLMPLFQNVQVLAVGQETSATPRIDSRYSKQSQDGAMSSLITVALAPQEANIVSFVQEQSKIRLVLRSPADSKSEPIRPVNWDTVFQYLMPQPAQAPKEEPKPRPTVEVYRGLQKERMPLSD